MNEWVKSSRVCFFKRGGNKGFGIGMEIWFCYILVGLFWSIFYLSYVFIICDMGIIIVFILWGGVFVRWGKCIL